MFESSTSKHSIYITSKRAPAKALPDGDVEMTSTSSQEHIPLLFRASNGVSDSSKIKFSTIVQPSQLSSFQAAYLPLLRSHLSTSLKKRDKAKERKTDKLREQARKKLVETVDGKEHIITNKIGSKRGAGRRKRQRALKKGAALRKEKAKDTKRKRQQQQSQSQPNTATAAASQK